MMNNNKKDRKRTVSNVFTYSAVIVGILVALGAIFPNQFGDMSGTDSAWVNEYFGWYYMSRTTMLVFFCVFLMLSPIGKLKLGRPNDKPELRTISWHAMLFSAGMGIGLVFYGASEPVSDFIAPASADPQTNAAVLESMRSTFLHYGFHAWAMYGVVALALA